MKGRRNECVAMLPMEILRGLACPQKPQTETRATRHEDKEEKRRYCHTQAREKCTVHHANPTGLPDTSCGSYTAAEKRSFSAPADTLDKCRALPVQFIAAGDTRQDIRPTASRRTWDAVGWVTWRSTSRCCCVDSGWAAPGCARYCIS